MLSRFDTMPECDRQTDTHDDCIYRASIASRGKNPQRVVGFWKPLFRHAAAVWGVLSDPTAGTAKRLSCILEATDSLS